MVNYVEVLGVTVKCVGCGSVVVLNGAEVSRCAECGLRMIADVETGAGEGEDNMFLVNVRYSSIEF